jgi:hypothetical protein
MASCSCWVLYRWWVDHWCTDVSWVWRMRNSNAAALLHNNNKRKKTGYYTIKVTEYYTTIDDALSCYTESPKYNSALSYITREPEYSTEAPKYYITKAPEYRNTTRLVCCPCLLHRCPYLLQHQRATRSTTLQPTLPRATTPTSRSITVRKRRGSQVLLCSQLLTAPTLLTTSLFPAATLRLPLIYPPKQSNNTPKRQSTSLPRATQPELRRPSITHPNLPHKSCSLVLRWT